MSEQGVLVDSYCSLLQLSRLFRIKKVRDDEEIQKEDKMRKVGKGENKLGFSTVHGDEVTSERIF